MSTNGEARAAVCRGWFGEQHDSAEIFDVFAIRQSKIINTACLSCLSVAGIYMVFCFSKPGCLVRI